MYRKAFFMKLNPGCESEYTERHDEIWPELGAVLKSHGVHNYSIFLSRPTNQLVGYVEIESEARWNEIADSLVCKKWWSYMQDIMATNDDNSPVSEELIEVFHFD